MNTATGVSEGGEFSVCCSNFSSYGFIPIPAGTILGQGHLSQTWNIRYHPWLDSTKETRLWAEQAIEVRCALRARQEAAGHSTGRLVARGSRTSRFKSEGPKADHGGSGVLERIPCPQSRDRAESRHEGRSR